MKKAIASVTGLFSVAGIAQASEGIKAKFSNEKATTLEENEKPSDDKEVVLDLSPSQQVLLRKLTGHLPSTLTIRIDEVELMESASN